MNKRNAHKFHPFKHHLTLLFLLISIVIVLLYSLHTPQNPVLLMVFNNKHNVEAENLLSSIDKNAKELRSLIEVCVSDNSSEQFALKHNLRAFAMSRNDNSGTYKTYGFNLFMQRKIEAILYLLRKNHDVLYVDTDIVFLGNPINEINHNFDLNIQNDGCGRGHDPLVLCAGFMYIKANLRTISFFNKVILEIKKQNYKITDQCALNSILQAKPNEISFTILDDCKFANGCRYFAGSQQHCSKSEALIIHNNHLIGIENKMQRFKDHQLIFS